MNEVFNTLSSSNLNAAAGTNGLPGLLFKECWKSLGVSLCEVIRELFVSAPPSKSMRTAIMIFSSKPNKLSSFKPKDKQRLSILCTDFKIYEGLLARRFRKLSHKIGSPHQYLASNDRIINHGISRARDTITAANRTGMRCGIADQDYVCGFDFLVLKWVWMVLKSSGVSEITLGGLKRL